MRETKVGLIPVSGKPYHAGHHSLVTTAAAENDKVILFVSTSNRMRKGEFPIYGKDMKRIWAEELEPIMPGNVEIQYGGSPVRKVYQVIEEACASGREDQVFTIYSDPQDTVQNYPQDARDRYMEPMCSIGKVIFAAEENPEKFTRGQGTPDVSGGKLRHYLETNNFERFASFMPPNVDAQNIFDILRAHLSENVIRDFVFAVLK
jgi:hypothetical protein|tara:strand:- start:3240 stop:3854 length:615 start_codon:yes stop_codon:yes gene_type:complete